MNLSAIVLARAVALVEIDDLTPRHELFPTSLRDALVERYGFLKAPEKFEDMANLQNGIRFELGAFEGVLIAAFAVLPGGLLVDTGSSTDDAERVIEDVLTWAKEEFGITYEPAMIKRRAYVSQVTFTSDIPLDALNPKLRGIAERVTKAVANGIGHEYSFELSGLTFAYETTFTKPHAPNFIIERRADIPYSDNKYFSSAPMRTSEHLGLLEDFEAALKG